MLATKSLGTGSVGNFSVSHFLFFTLNFVFPEPMLLYNNNIWTKVVYVFQSRKQEMTFKEQIISLEQTPAVLNLPRPTHIPKCFIFLLAPPSVTFWAGMCLSSQSTRRTAKLLEQKYEKGGEGQGEDVPKQAEHRAFSRPHGRLCVPGLAAGHVFSKLKFSKRRLSLQSPASVWQTQSCGDKCRRIGFCFPQ